MKNIKLASDGNLAQYHLNSHGLSILLIKVKLAMDTRTTKLKLTQQCDEYIVIEFQPNSLRSHQNYKAR